MFGKTCLVTGANSGLGKAIALGLATSGATTVMLCRDRQRGESARAEIVVTSGNDSVELLIADLSSQRETRCAAFQSPARGARTPLYLATSPEVADISGAYFVKNEMVESSPESYDRPAAKRLWQVSAELTGVSGPDSS